jgi:chromosomal replication initiation ATPase DnaA
VERLRERAGSVNADPPSPEARQLAGLDPADACAALAEYYELDAADLARRHDAHVARVVAAWLCRRYSEASLQELAKHFGLSRADSVPNLTRRAEARLRTSPELAHDIDRIIRRIEGKTKNNV